MTAGSSTDACHASKLSPKSPAAICSPAAAASFFASSSSFHTAVSVMTDGSAVVAMFRDLAISLPEALIPARSAIFAQNALSARQFRTGVTRSSVLPRNFSGRPAAAVSVTRNVTTRTSPSCASSVISAWSGCAGAPNTSVPNWFAAAALIRAALSGSLFLTVISTVRWSSSVSSAETLIMFFRSLGLISSPAEAWISSVMFR